MTIFEQVTFFHFVFGFFLYPFLLYFLIKNKEINKKLRFVLLLIVSLAFAHWMYLAAHFDDDKICWDKGGEWVDNKCKFKND